ncbi:unnamed protein product [Timema podura]|uniref:Ig-like domain-containing protein n=1 Tax=Timema podura TaxID=61482 RepID=A0ABN7NQ54_TIMPD|nr:unnamed protein product [Timema podura]
MNLQHGSPTHLSVSPKGSPAFIFPVASMGRPRPRVTWFLENTVVDDSYESRPDGITVNHLTFPNIGRQHLHARLVCQAVNTHLANPTSKVVVLDINRECSYVVVKPISVKILTQESQISADRRYEVECRSSGSRPEAIITWWKGSRQIKRITKNRLSEDKPSQERQMENTVT